MESEPRPVEIRHAVVGTILMALGAYIGGGAVWSWLFWADQHIDTSRLFALLFAFVSIMGGWTLIARWFAGEWYERRRRWSSGDPPSPQDTSTGHSGPTSDPGSSDRGSCSS